MVEQRETNSTLHQQEICENKTLDIPLQVTKLCFKLINLVSLCSIL